VDKRLRAMASSVEPRVKPRAGAAMWMPIFQPPSGLGVTEKASSISVVEASSIENAATSACGRSAGKTGGSKAGKFVPSGNCSNRKRL
jgi:hypothetical protein